MLNTIKNLINQKKDFLEAAEIIFEDGLGNELDDLIILGEDAMDITENEDSVELDEDSSTEDSAATEEPVAEPKNEPNDDNSDITDSPIEDTVVPAENDTNDDLLNSPVDDDTPTATTEPTEAEETPMPLPGDDTLPEPVSNVTGEPVADDGILSMEIDMGSNTPKDILPVPPAGAVDAVVSDDIMDQRIDSGFGEDEVTQPIVDNSSENDIVEEDVSEDLLSEAISLGDEPASTEAPAETAPAEDTTSAEASVEEPAADASTDVAPAEEDTPVTAAVKDKVAEADAAVEVGNPEDAKAELMKKLSNITKNIEDAKNAIMKSI